MVKNYRLSAQDIVVGLADSTPCFATDRITVDGRPVGFMYCDADGWNFFAGDEDQDYVDNSDNLGLFTLNDIANYDRAILPYLQAAPGSAWVRQGNSFIEDPDGAPVDPDEPADAILTPDFPTVDGRFEMTSDWVIKLVQPMNRRFEDDALVLWRPGLTAWITLWGNPNRDSEVIRLNKIKQMSSPRRYDDREWAEDGLLYFSYRLAENSGDNRAPVLYGNVVGIVGHVQAAVYFDREADLASAAALVAGIGPNGPQTRATLSI